MERHIVLVGDSIFDNAAYVPGGPSVLGHLRRMLPSDDLATLVAVDGSTVGAVFRQLDRIPGDATHLVLSVGGNDALWLAGNLYAEETIDVRSSLERIAEAISEFTVTYRGLISELRTLQLPLVACTIYDTVPGLEPADLVGLSMFNDVIAKTAFEFGHVLIDLRTICNESTDYSTISPIEPSASGGGKIARAIINAIATDGSFQRVYC
ncbi:MAG: SGNH/GDSL hydrolase family protein [bacterium]|nr:SGNH/GDSL hydrolase family protein [bacterium]